jgi:hypothetical protein
VPESGMRIMNNFESHASPQKLLSR